MKRFFFKEALQHRWGLVVGLIIGLVLGGVAGTLATSSKSPIVYRSSELLLSGRNFLQTDKRIQLGYVLGACDMLKTVALVSKTPYGEESGLFEIELVGNLARGQKDPFPTLDQPASWLKGVKTKSAWPSIKHLAAFGVMGDMAQRSLFSVLQRSTVGDLQDSAVEYIQDHPETQGWGAAYILWEVADDLNTEWTLSPAR